MSTSSRLRLRAEAILALTGALAFATALVCGAWFFTVRLGPVPAAPGNRPQAVAFNLALFGLFALHHSLCARLGVRRMIATALSPRLERTAYVWIASALFIAMCLAWRSAAGTVWELRSGAQAIGYAMQAIGAWFMIAAVRVTGFAELAGIDWVLAGDEIDRRGIVEDRWPYGFVRHPTYLGLVLLTFGAPVMSLGRLTFAFGCLVYLLLAIPFEERSLERMHGAAYARYRRRVPWRMLPGLY